MAQLVVCLSLRWPILNPRPVDVNGGGQSISGSGSLQNTRWFKYDRD